MQTPAIVGRAVLTIAVACLVAVGAVACGSSGDSGPPVAGAPVSVAAAPTAAASATGTSDAGWSNDLCTLLPVDATEGLSKQDGDAATQCFYSAGDSSDLRSVSLARTATPVTKDAVDERLASSRSESLGAVNIGGHSGWAWADWTIGSGFVWLNAGSGSVMVIVTDMSKDQAVNLSAAKTLATRLSDTLPD